MTGKRKQSGDPVLPSLGDRVSLHDITGIVVADLERRAFASGYSRHDWEYLANGYLLLDDEIGLVHVPSGDDLSDDVQPQPIADDDDLGSRAGGLRTLVRDALARYDGRSTTILSEISVRHHNRAGFLEALIELAGENDTMVSEGVTWVLKSELETGRRLDEDLTVRLVAAVDTVTAWQAQLHICQIIAYLNVPENAREALRQWLIQRLDADRPFLRAWALDGLCHLPDTPFGALLDRMADDPSASVQARVRNLRKQVARRGGA